MDLDALLHDVDFLTLIALCFVFTGIAAYAFWPGSQAAFDEAARLPLKED
ncbi:cbb3-type cytochrome oxidase subunit 3 [Methylocapsa palsarum]|uniref:Cytochrome c oxidase cbb3-type subunit 4 n=1 Tax=Methylocapsa palsarum TaxID=1612308 RepID=A0A1I3ZA90_9HYPH|nr:cbb3-type cytochrome c oxidase subunit 3 [Methylocapsa palsarum]SFK40925.1 cytochrome c oxidase cbb3-type subunit 4 [Methylocapsa palsarum]